MSDKDTGHTLTELQEARAEIDRLRKINQDQFEAAFNLIKWIEELHELVRWRKLSEEAPQSQGQYQAFWDKSEGVFVVNYDPFTQAEWKHCIAPPLYWRPIGPLPGGE